MFSTPYFQWVFSHKKINIDEIRNDLYLIFVYDILDKKVWER